MADRPPTPAEPRTLTVLNRYATLLRAVKKLK
jgi:hypothetical protein